MPATIAIVDDDPDIRDYLRQTLRVLHRVIEAPDGLAGLQLIREQRPDVAILDLGMPGINGLDLARKVREDEELATIPIIILTGAVRGEEVSGQVWRLGTEADEFLEKPATPEQILGAVDRLLKKKAGYRPLPPGKGYYD